MNEMLRRLLGCLFRGGNGGWGGVNGGCVLIET